MVDDCFVHGCLLLLDVSIGSVLSKCVFLFSHRFWSCRYGFLTFYCLWEIIFSMISGTFSWLLGLDKIFK